MIINIMTLPENITTLLLWYCYECAAWVAIPKATN